MDRKKKKTNQTGAKKCEEKLNESFQKIGSIG